VNMRHLPSLPGYTPWGSAVGVAWDKNKIVIAPNTRAALQTKKSPRKEALGLLDAPEGGEVGWSFVRWSG